MANHRKRKPSSRFADEVKRKIVLSRSDTLGNLLPFFAILLLITTLKHVRKNIVCGGTRVEEPTLFYAIK